MTGFQAFKVSNVCNGAIADRIRSVGERSVAFGRWVRPIMQKPDKASQRPDALHFWEFVNEDPIGNSSGMIRKSIVQSILF